MRSSKLSRWFGGSHGILLSLYAFFVLFTFAILRVSKLQYLPKWFLVTAAISAAVCPPLLRRAEKLRLLAPAAGEGKNRGWALAFFAVPFLCFLVKYLVYYPGGFTFDSFIQYEQALSGQYNNWHPVIHTLLFFNLPLALTGGWTGSIVLFQIVWFSLALCYAFSTLRRAAGNRFALFSLAFVLLNPETTNIAVFPWKDAAFGMGALLLVSFVLKIFCSSGEWLRKPLNLIAFAAVLALTALVRHNAVLFVVPLALALFFLAPWKRVLALCCCAAVLAVGVNGPLYSALKAEAPGERAVEMLGLPLAVIGACAKYAPETLDAETREFVYRLAPREVWDDHETLGDFNTVKWDPRTDTSVVESYGAGRVLSMAARCFARAPLISLQGLIRLTDVVYTVSDDYNYCDYPLITDNAYGIETRGIPFLQKAFNTVSGVLNLVLPWLFQYVGAMHFALLAVLLAKCRLRRKADRKKILPVLAVFAYNFGTALLLTGAADSSRFFHYTFMLTPLLLALLLRDPGQEA